MNILQPVRSATKELSRNNSRVGDFITAFTSTIEAVGNTFVLAQASKLKQELAKSLP